MRAVDIIAKKRDGNPLTDEEIYAFINGYTQGDIPDYQASALLMAIYWRGMDECETATLTDAMVQSGDQLNLRHLGRTVDKHSSGGVGDKTTLVVGPMVAALGLPVAKMSGRGLGFTGGTIDKLESIPGFSTQLSHDQFLRQVDEIGLVVAGATAALAPADGKLYALRDVTATVSSLPLIAASIMSKKLAAGADAIVLDVKVGEGAFMETLEEGRALARAMVDIGARMGRDVTALLSDMNQPLGQAVGNVLEVQEALDTLHSQGPADFTEHCITVAAHMLLLGHKAETLEQAQTMAQATLADGTAWDKFSAMVAAQGGDISYLENPAQWGVAPVVRPLLASQSATLAHINAREVGLTVMQLGGGRAKKEDDIDPLVGVVLHTKVGDAVEIGTPILTIHARTEEDFEQAQERLAAACTWADHEVTPPPLFYDVISSTESATSKGQTDD